MFPYVIEHSDTSDSVTICIYTSYYSCKKDQLNESIITPTKKKNETKRSYHLYIFFTKFETMFQVIP